MSLGQSLSAQPVKSGLEDWLRGNGLSLGPGLVLSAQSGSLPIPVERNVGGFTVNEIELATYPYIVDVRGNGLDPPARSRVRSDRSTCPGRRRSASTLNTAGAAS